MDWRDQLYQNYVSSGQGGAGALTFYLPQMPFYMQLIKRHMPKEKSARILDLACGAGGLLFCLKKQGYSNLKGVDLSEQMIALAHQSDVKEAKVGDVFATLRASPDASIEVIFAMDILEHLDRAALFDFCSEVHRILAPEGRFIAHVPNASGIFGNLIRYDDLTHELAFTSKTMNQLLKTIGFADVKCYEDRPVPHGVKSIFRAVVWELVSLPFRVLFAAETGRFKVILSQNLTAVADRGK